MGMPSLLIIAPNMRPSPPSDCTPTLSNSTTAASSPDKSYCRRLFGSDCRCRRVHAYPSDAIRQPASMVKNAMRTDQHVISGVHFLEHLRRFLVALHQVNRTQQSPLIPFTSHNTTSAFDQSPHQISVRMVFEREFSVGGCDLLLRGVAGHAQQLVVVPLRRRRSGLHPGRCMHANVPVSEAFWRLFRVDFDRGKERMHVRTCADAASAVN